MGDIERKETLEKQQAKAAKATPVN